MMLKEEKEREGGEMDQKIFEESYRTEENEGGEWWQEEDSRLLDGWNTVRCGIRRKERVKMEGRFAMNV